MPADLATHAEVHLSEGAPFLSDQDLKSRLDEAGVPPDTAEAITTDNAGARIDGLRASLSLLAVIALAALFLTRRIPSRQPAPTPTPVGT
ncbi:putative membrane protein [Candidatus Protofrankia californiensis]|uniref:Putative membrane protein n=1 Tax=Candidatus Protofrankia californiensis TaxID=1839754 RepID=A0A1C3NWR5_9ACTN|nr:putative membrane protein [Candidatus Protofrankia californiensis]